LRTISNPPPTLDINPLIGNPNLENMQNYLLKSMISHIGNTAAQGKITKVLKLLVNYTIYLFLGHYVSYITDRNGKNRWSCFDDSNVSIIETNPIGSDPLQQIVVFVYIRDDIKDY
jgi:hypothetical protein